MPPGGDSLVLGLGAAGAAGAANALGSDVSAADAIPFDLEAYINRVRLSAAGLGYRRGGLDYGHLKILLWWSTTIRHAHIRPISLQKIFTRKRGFLRFRSSPRLRSVVRRHLRILEPAMREDVRFNPTA